MVSTINKRGANEDGRANAQWRTQGVQDNDSERDTQGQAGPSIQRTASNPRGVNPARRNSRHAGQRMDTSEQSERNGRKSGTLRRSTRVATRVREERHLAQLDRVEVAWLTRNGYSATALPRNTQELINLKIPNGRKTPTNVARAVERLVDQRIADENRRREAAKRERSNNAKADTQVAEDDAMDIDAAETLLSMRDRAGQEVGAGKGLSDVPAPFPPTGEAIQGTTPSHIDNDIPINTDTEDSGAEMGLAQEEEEMRFFSPSPPPESTIQESGNHDKSLDDDNQSLTTSSDSGKEMALSVQENLGIFTPSDAGTEYESWDGFSSSSSQGRNASDHSTPRAGSQNTGSPPLDADGNMDMDLSDPEIEDDEEEQNSERGRRPQRKAKTRARSKMRSQSAPRASKRRESSSEASEELEWSPGRRSTAPRMGQEVVEEIDYNERGRPIRTAKTAAQGEIQRQISGTRGQSKKRKG